MFFDKRKLYTFFKNRYILRKPSNGWYPFDCPFCVDGDSKAKHAVNFEYEFTKCWVCGFRGRVIDFVMESERLEYFQAKAILQEQEEARIDLEVLEGLVMNSTESNEVILPHGYVGLLEGTGVLGKRARTYLMGRGFDIEVLDSMGFGYCNQKCENDDDNYFGYIIVPFKKRGKLQYFLGRDFVGNFRRYKNPATEKFGIGKSELVFNEDALELYKRVFVLEGWSDAMTIGKEATATLGWSLSSAQKSKYMKSRAEELCFVADKGFYKKAVEVAMNFLDVKKVVKVVSLENEPGAEDENKDVNAIGIERFWELYKQTEPLTFEAALNLTM